MKKVFFIGCAVFWLWSLPLMAVLPPDAQARNTEIIRQRVQARADYEQQQKDYEKAIIASKIRTEALMKLPPWMNTEAGSLGKRTEKAHPDIENGKLSLIYHRLFLSMVLLILIGVGVGWVRHATREVDK